MRSSACGLRLTAYVSGVQPLAKLPRENLDGAAGAAGQLLLPDRLRLEAPVADRLAPRAQRGVELSGGPDVAAAAPDHRDDVRHDPDERAQRGRRADRILAPGEG